MNTLDVRELAFPYREAGPADGPGVLLLHGFPQLSLEWTAQLAALGAAGYHAVAPDQRGYAASNRPEAVAAYAMDELVADVVAMLDALGWERAHLVGHDWGGSVAWHVAGRHPDRLRSLTIASTPHPLAMSRVLATSASQQEKSGYMQLFRQEGTAEDLLLADDAAVLRAVYRGLPTTETYVAHFRERPALTAALNWYRTMRRDDGEKTGTIRVPTLYVWGEDDFALGREVAEATGGLVEGEYTFVPLAGAGHWLPEASADELNALLLDHLRRRDR